MELTIDLNTYWYAIYVKARHEFCVLRRLIGAGIEAFLPVVERLSKWKDRKKLVEFPLFPGYLFVHIQKNYDTMLSILKTPGVVRFVGTIPKEPEAVPEHQILSLMRLIEHKETIDPYPYLKEGQRIRVRRGPLKGIEGILVNRAGQHHLVISIDLLRQGVSVKIDAIDIEPA